jgi:hypothetical protein
MTVVKSEATTTLPEVLHCTGSAPTVLAIGSNWTPHLNPVDGLVCKILAERAQERLGFLNTRQ